jgi:hypothetical protein
MTWQEYVADVLKRLEGHYHVMAGALPAPALVNRGGAPFFRHQELSDNLLCLLKGVKLVSNLNASLLLYRGGFTQELGALSRISDDLANDILFMLKPLDGEKPSKDQVRFFEEFFQEEFDNPNDPLGSAQKRDNVSRRKVHATFAHLAKDHVNPSDGQAMVSTIHAALSGYVHGAYPHIMEMYGGNPPRFHMSGMRGTPRMAEWSSQIVNYVYRTIMVAELTARKLGQEEMEKQLRALLIEFETKLNCKPDEHPEAQLRRMKEKAKG